MDAFTENILARARKRQRLLEGYSNENSTPLRENNRIAISEPNLNETKPIPRKEVASDSNIPSKLKNFEVLTKENVPEGNLPSKNFENKSDSELNRFIRQNSVTKVSSSMPGSPKSQAKFLNIQRDNFNMEIKLTSSENVKVQVEIEEHTDSEDDGPNDNQMTVDDGKVSDKSSDAGSQISSEGGLREESKNRLMRLGKLYAGGLEADISSPIHRTEARFYQDLEINSRKPSENSSDMPVATSKAKKGLSKLAALADEINHWEDDLSHPKPLGKKSTSPRRGWKPPAPQPPSVEKSPPKSPSKKPKAPSPPASKSGSVSSSPSSSVHGSPTKKTPIGSPTKHDPYKFLPGSPTANRVAPRSPTKGAGGSPTKNRVEGGAQCVGVTPKKINWDKAVLDTLDNQPKGLVATAHLDIKSQSTPEQDEKEVATGAQAQENSVAAKPSARSDAIARRAAMFEGNSKNETSVPVKAGKDPAFLSLSERKALFEKNKGEALVPKAAFGMSAPVKVDTTMKASESKFIGVSKSNESIKSALKSNESIKSASKSTESLKSIFEKKENIDKNIQCFENHSKIVEKSKETFEKTAKVTEKSPPTNQKPFKPKNSAPKPPPLAEKPTATSPVAAVHQSGGIASTVAALLEKKATISEEQIFNQAKSERQKEIEMLLNRFNKNKGITEQENKIEELPYSSDDEDETDETAAMIRSKDRPVSIVSINEQSKKSAEKRKSGGSRLSCDSDHPQVVSVLEDVKRIKVSPPKAGRLYPCLSDIEATTGEDTRTPSPDDAQEENSLNDSQYDSEDPNTSFGREILQTVVQNQTPKKIAYHDSTGSEGSSIMGELDEILDEYDDDDYSSAGPTPPKQGRHHLTPESNQGRPSNSFHYKSYPSPSKSQNFQSPMKSVNVVSPRPSAELPVVVEGENILPLTHTVSFYRKQQNEKTQTPVKKVVMQPLIQEDDEEEGNDDEEVGQKIKELQNEVNKQQNIISQTSQALNLCSSTPEFSGSTEQVEAERVLLVATHRRQAALHELQRLGIEGTIRPKNGHSQSLPLEKGTLTISNIVLPLKQKYVTALAAAGGKGHHVVCLIKCGEQVVTTKLVSTVASSSKNPDFDLYVPGSVTLNNICNDFTVTFEVYCLQAQEECLPHEVKYHINKKGSKNSATPKKSKHESRLTRPPKESPAGPHAVRTSSFALMGYVVFSVQAVNKKVWSLNNTPPMSPLEGSVEMKISCELAVSVEHRGFLTMFEDVSGFGAWHRRWYLLKGDSLSYWKYPDNEKKMPPIDTIDLNTCVTETVAQVSREICARMHTFLLERERDAQPHDKDSLVSVRKGEKTLIRHLLSADTKEERIEWCQKLNLSLRALRTWGTCQ